MRINNSKRTYLIGSEASPEANKKQPAMLWEKRKAIALFVLLLMMGLKQTNAQVLPPDLTCVTNATLKWHVPVNTCGDFIAYHIFGAQNESGPYSEIGTITNQFETSFIHQNAAVGTWYYYMETEADCVGHPVLQSDTLDNLIPAAGGIRSVSVNADVTQIDWYLSPSPEVYAYIISKETNMGTVVVDTVYTGNTYFDFDANPDGQITTYFVTVIDECGNESLVVNPHNNILLSSQNNGGCERSISLSWNAYINWDNGVEQYNVYASTDGGEFELAGSSPGDVLTFDYENILSSSIYCFYIEAVEYNTGVTARSNQICKSVDLVQPVVGLAFVNANITSENEVRLSWVWDVNSTIAETTVNYWSEGDDVIYVEDYPISLPLTNANSATIQTDAFNSHPTFYQISTTDSCGVNLLSNPIGLVYLSGQTDGGGVNQLAWTPYVNELMDTVYYDLYRLATNVPEKLTTVGADGKFVYEDLIELSDPSQLESCYYIVARGTVTLPDTTVLETFSYSNTICLAQNANIYFPNAIAPEGVNKIFKPIMQFGVPLTYSMVIYDRWGGKLFESKDIGQGWDGTKNGRPMPQGVYLYHIELTKEDGERVVKTGTVVLLR